MTSRAFSLRSSIGEPEPQTVYGQGNMRLRQENPIQNPPSNYDNDEGFPRRLPSQPLFRTTNHVGDMANGQEWSPTGDFTQQQQQSQGQQETTLLSDLWAQQGNPQLLSLASQSMSLSSNDETTPTKARSPRGFSSPVLSQDDMESMRRSRLSPSFPQGNLPRMQFEHQERLGRKNLTEDLNKSTTMTSSISSSSSTMIKPQPFKTPAPAPAQISVISTKGVSLKQQPKVYRITPFVKQAMQQRAADLFRQGAGTRQEIETQITREFGLDSR